MVQDFSFDDTVKITVKDELVLTGRLSVPKNCKAVIIFSYSGGSSHKSMRDIFVAEALQKEGFATLLVDLLAPEEGQMYAHRFDIDTLATRLTIIKEWVTDNPHTEALDIGLFGADYGAAVALFAVAKTDGKISTAVLVSGRLGLARPMVKQIRKPVLLLVGSHDEEILALNQKALEYLSDESKLIAIEGVGRSFKEPGKLEELSRMAGDWFLKFL